MDIKFYLLRFGDVKLNKNVMENIIKKLEWDNTTNIEHVYPCVSVAFVNLPVQGDWEAHIAICDEGNYGFKATLWLMNGGYGIAKYCRTIEEAKTEAEKWWINFVSGFLK